jgi:hypothetical protein
MGTTRKEVSRILAVGRVSSDGVQRLTQGQSFVCCQGEEEEHQRLQAFCCEVEQLLESSGLELRDFTPEEFQEWLRSFSPKVSHF